MLTLIITLATPALVTADDAKFWVTDETLRNPPAEDWLMWRRTVDGWAHSPLDQINKDNVDQLSMAWAIGMGPGMQQVTPLVHNGVMYLAHVGNTVQAVDATNGDLNLGVQAPTRPCYPDDIPPGNPHLAIYENKIFLATLDAHIVALHTKTGEVLWDHEVADYTYGYRYTSGAIVFKDKVVAAWRGARHQPPGAVSSPLTMPERARNSGEYIRSRNRVIPQEASWAGLPIERRLGGSAWLTRELRPRNQFDLLGYRRTDSVWRGSARRQTIAALYTNLYFGHRHRFG